MNEQLMKENLKSMQLPCSSSRFGKWKKRDKVNKAIELSGDYLPTEGNCCVLFSKVPIENLPEGPILLISSHADFVPQIKHPWCEEEGDFFKGTFDNSITNATVLNLMQMGELPENVILALTGDEETGGCYGAKEALSILEHLGVPLENIYPIALDVTHEGFDCFVRFQDRAVPIVYTIENVSRRDAKITNIAERLSEQNQELQFVCSPIDAVPKGVSSYHYGQYRSWFDEGYAYRNFCGRGFSVCIPCKGEMHSETGLYVNKEVYYGYNQALLTFLEAYNEKLCETYKNRQSIIM